MTGNKEIQLMHDINSKMVKLTQDLSDVIQTLSELTILVYDSEIDKLNETEIKLRSHM